MCLAPTGSARGKGGPVPHPDLIPCLVRADNTAVFFCESCATQARDAGQDVRGIPRATVRRALNARDEFQVRCVRCRTTIPLVVFAEPRRGANPFENLVDYTDPDGGFVRDGFQVFTVAVPDAFTEGHPVRVNDTIWILHHTVKLADSVLLYCQPPIMWHDQPKREDIVRASEHGQLLVVRVLAPAGMPVNVQDVEAAAIRQYAEALGLDPEDPAYPAHVVFMYHTLPPGVDAQAEIRSFRQEVYRRMGLGKYPAQGA